MVVETKGEREWAGRRVRGGGCVMVVGAVMVWWWLLFDDDDDDMVTMMTMMTMTMMLMMMMLLMLVMMVGESWGGGREWGRRWQSAPVLQHLRTNAGAQQPLTRKS